MFAPFRCILCFIINAPPPRLSPTTATARGASRARLVPNATLFVYFIDHVRSSEVTTDEQTRESVHICRRPSTRSATPDASLPGTAAVAVARIDRLVQDMATLSLSVDKPRHQGVIQCSSSSSKKRRGRSRARPMRTKAPRSPPAAATAMPRVRLPTPSCQRPFLSLLSKSASRDAEAKAVAWARGTALELHGGLWCPSSAAALPACLLAARRSS